MVFEKLKFWKKKEAAPEFPGAMPEIPGAPAEIPPPTIPSAPAIPGMEYPEHVAPAPPQAAPPSAPAAFEALPKLTPMAPAPPPMPGREFEIISAKLDTLKAQLDVIIQRLERLESIARGEEPIRWR